MSGESQLHGKDSAEVSPPPTHTKGQFLEAGTRETSRYQILLFLVEYLSFSF